MGRLSSAFWKVLGGSRRRALSRSRAVVATAATLEEEYRELTEAELADRLAALSRRRPVDGDDGGTAGGTATFDRDDLVRFLALAREVSRRRLDMPAFDVQLLAAARMFAGDVVEMLTGEGKTLAGAIGATAFALRGRQVHVISVNDYLARRDAEWMAPLYEAFGLTVAWISATSTPRERETAYAADVTYAAVSEFGFDVLRDRLGTDPIVPAPQVALVDEADSVLVDEARVPLVLAGSTSGAAPDSIITDIVRALKPDVHYRTDEDDRNVFLTEKGAAAVEDALGGVDLYSEEHVGTTLSQVNVALHARVLLRRDVHYLVRDGRVQLINESRGRVAELQRWPDGLQAAVEAKEGLAVSDTGEVLDTMTVQALISRYPTVCGMTGTARAADEQLRTFYDLGVSIIPPNRPCIRVDEPSRVYATIADKEAAIVDYVARTHETGQPVLIGTMDVAESEHLAKLLERAGVDCVVLNAKNDAAEAAIIAEAGALGAVTVSTQMAGRGTDIRLGGSDQADHEKVKELGGLCVVGTNRHVSRRLDEQLRGRAGRQGDPGRSIFFSSLEDDLVVRHAPDARLPTATQEDGQVTGPAAERLLDHAQRVADAALLEIHSNTFRYSRLSERHRAILDERRDVLLGTDTALRELERRCPDRYRELSAEIDEEVLVSVARRITLFHLDRCWVEHLAFLSDLRESIHLHALGKQNPLDEYHRAAIPAFRDLLGEVDERAARTFEEATITAEGIDLDDAGLVRPTATWTYLVQDNPFGSELDRAFRGIRRMLDGRRGRADDED
ncbi:accessory Sec system translocase SecA2 [Actinoalloteichus spitiensis]|uniref:accessory Sec system translocase SecA2 n=1 Tax=Actinoalloteichus spitiensis TaxID=252394 RepID=UPI00037E4F7E|nr:accessory Sec system translocase SecA2 [Actinoalloteichus spitiensis]